MNEPNNNGHESISPELLTLIRSLAAKAQAAKASYETVIQEVSLQYKLGIGDAVDLATGKISRKPEEARLEAVA